MAYPENRSGCRSRLRVVVDRHHESLDVLVAPLLPGSEASGFGQRFQKRVSAQVLPASAIILSLASWQTMSRWNFGPRCELKLVRGVDPAMCRSATSGGFHSCHC